MTDPEPPDYLSEESAVWFAQVLERWELDESEVVILTRAAVALDRAEQARTAIAEHGTTFLDRFGQVRARQRETGRSLCFRSAHFLRFRNGKLTVFRSIADTFDVVQQVVGHPIDVTKPIEHVPLVPEQDEVVSL